MKPVGRAEAVKRFLLIIAVVFALLVAAPLIHFLTPPTFSLSQVGTTKQGVRISIKPNFVVNSIRSITVMHSGRTLVSRNDVLVGRQLLDIPGEFDSSDVLTVSCDLQFDRFSALVTDIEKQLVLK